MLNRLLPPLLVAACAPTPVPASDGPGLRLLTYNVNFERLDPATVDAIAAADADVVFLQETTAPWESAIRARLSYPTMLFRSHDPDGGMAILSRWPVAEQAWMDSPVGAFPAWCVVIESPLGPLRALHVHLHPPLDENGLLSGYFTTGGKRRAEIEAYLPCLPDLAVGDFNEESGDAVSMVEARGLRDAAGATPTRTWRWETSFGELQGRPDHVFVGPGIGVRKVEVLETGASDHRPLRVELQR